MRGAGAARKIRGDFGLSCAGAIKKAGLARVIETADVATKLLRIVDSKCAADEVKTIRLLESVALVKITARRTREERSAQELRNLVRARNCTE